MPAQFWTDEPEDNRSIEDIVKAFDQVPDGESPVIRELAVNGMKVKPGRDYGVNKDGDEYRPSTLTDDHGRYSKYHKIGTIVNANRSDDWIEVKWEDGEGYDHHNCYRAGKNLGRVSTKKIPLVEAYDLYVYQEDVVQGKPEPEILVTAENRKIGMRVKPSSMFGKGESGTDAGKSWYFPEFVGTTGGVITDFYKGETLEDYIFVKWDTGREQYYKAGKRLGTKPDQYDLAIASESDF
jgi:hypothetical protein